MASEDIPKILVVNDNPASLLGLTGLLDLWTAELSYEVMTARSGEEALRHVLNSDFAVILLDVKMPGMDGFETAEAIHLRPSSRSIPIIFVTAFLADEMNRLRGYEMGAVDYLFTPVVPQILKAKVSVFVALARKNQQLKAQAEMLNERTSELIAINTRLEHEISERQLAEQRNQAKDEFLAMLGHELRNPLSAISTAAQLVHIAGADPHNVEHANEVIQRQSRHLSRIVDDLLDMSRVMAGKIILNRRPVDLYEFVKGCVETLQLTGRTQSHSLSLRGESVWVEADATRLEQMVVNLLDNAVKYTPPGGQLTVLVESKGMEVEFSVRDSGLGIPPELLPHVFDVFVQGERSLDRAQGGLGIGLSLVRQLAQLHGGSVAADSAGPGSGSIFTVRLPRVDASAGATPRAAAAANGQCSVLLIEDHKDGRDIMAMMLSSYGNHVLEAENGTDGLRIAETEKPHVALVDIGLPGINGYEVARRLRANPDTCAMRLIALTGYGTEADSRRAIEAGFDLHLVKPVDSDILLAAIGGDKP